MNFYSMSQGRNSVRDRPLIKLLKSPGLLVSASGISKTIFLLSDPDELRKRLTLFLHGKKLVIFVIFSARKLLL